MFASDSPENIESMSAKKLPPVDVDRTMLDAVEGHTYDSPKFPSAYREYLDNLVPVDNSVEYQYMYIFGDMPFSMEAAKKVPQAKIDEMMNAVAAEQLRRWGVDLGIGRSDSVTHADIDIPLSEESSQAVKDAVQRVLDENSGDGVVIIAGDVLSDDEIKAQKGQ